MAKRDSRVIDRAVQSLAKAINISMKQKTLDPLTAKHFQWMNGRMIASEREELNGTRTNEIVLDPAIISRDKTAEKGRVRRLKVKVLRLLDRPEIEWSKLVGPEWVELLG